jgi:hypothetical protein
MKVAKKIYRDINSTLIWIEKNILAKHPYITYVVGSAIIIKIWPAYSTIPVLLLVDKIARIIVVQTDINVNLDSTMNKYFVWNSFKAFISHLLTGLEFTKLFVNSFLFEFYNKYLIHQL